MPSPQGLFEGMSLTDLQSELSVARGRLRGDRVSLSGAQKSSGKNFSLSAREHIQEVLFSLNKLTGNAPPTRTHFNANDTLR